MRSDWRLEEWLWWQFTAVRRCRTVLFHFVIIIWAATSHLASAAHCVNISLGRRTATYSSRRVADSCPGPSSISTGRDPDIPPGIVPGHFPHPDYSPLFLPCDAINSFKRKLKTYLFISAFSYFIFRFFYYVFWHLYCTDVLIFVTGAL